MAVYFFDTRNDGDVLRDDVGVECRDFEAVRTLAARGLAVLAVDVLPGSIRRVLGVDVRGAHGQLVLVTDLVFEARAWSLHLRAAAHVTYVKQQR
jgi:hypothetical protein